MRRHEDHIASSFSAPETLLAEAILNHKGAPKFKAYSAGSHPSPAEFIQAHCACYRMPHLAADGLRSKGPEEFEKTGAPQLDFVFTVLQGKFVPSGRGSR